MRLFLSNSPRQMRQTMCRSQCSVRYLHLGNARSFTGLMLLPVWLFLSSTSIANDLIIEDKAIYASDDRREVFESGKWLRKVARSVGAIVDSRKVSRSSTGLWQLVHGATGRDQGWCDTERFIDQPTAASCTGFLVSPSHLATSAHCVQPAEDPGAPGLACANMSVVFGYALDKTGKLNSEFQNEQVYRCHSVLAGENDPVGSDWRVVELDRDVNGIDALTVYEGVSVSQNWKLSIIGHPNGLPAKIGANASVVDASTEGYFVTDLDSYAGNSGSPVITLHDGQAVVVGLLSRGAPDFEQIRVGQQECQQSRSCTAESCGGEHVTPARVLQEYALHTLQSISAQ